MAVNYTNGELLRMKEQAIMNAREMQSRASIKDNNDHGRTENTAVPPQREQPQPSITFEHGAEQENFERRQKPCKEHGENTADECRRHRHREEIPQGRQPSSPAQDSDRLLLMSLLLILIADNADTMLIFALIYIMM